MIDNMVKIPEFVFQLALQINFTNAMYAVKTTRSQTQTIASLLVSIGMLFKLGLGLSRANGGSICGITLITLASLYLDGVFCIVTCSTHAFYAPYIWIHCAETNPVQQKVQNLTLQ